MASTLKHFGLPIRIVMTHLLKRVRKIANRILPYPYGPIIVMYHRIGNASQDPWSLDVSPQHFSEHLEVLAKHRHVMSLGELARRHQAGCLPRNATAITFDDGYANNLHIAKPLLERFGAPATVFVVSGFLNSACEPWWDELSTLLLDTKVLPNAVWIASGDQMHEWHTGGLTRSQRHELYYRVHRTLKPLPEPERRVALRQLRDHIGRMGVSNSVHRTMTTEELIALADGNLIDIGAHTATHPSLLCLGQTAQYEEIRIGKDILETWLGRSVRGFAYPYGDHDATTAAAVLDIGFSYACTTVEGVLQPNDNVLRLPRICVGDWNGDEFAKRFVPLTPSVLISRWRAGRRLAACG